MTPEPAASGSVRSSAVVNAEIRALFPRPFVALTAAESAEYERLLEEWAAALRAEIVEAA